jgi:hypothetical protein
MTTVAAAMKLLSVTLAMVLSCSVLMADGRHRAASAGPAAVKGPVPSSTFWIGYPFSDAAPAAAMFSAHAGDVMSPVMISTGDATANRFIVFFQLRGDAFYVPDSNLSYSPSRTNEAAVIQLNASPARIKGLSSMPDGNVMVWEVQ